jgi:hypothetical protein
VKTKLLLPCVLVFAGAALYLLPIAHLGLNVYDEGIRLYGAQRVLAGDLPYHDFFAYYGPAQFYWPALLFKLFGERILVARLGAILFVALAAMASFAIGRRAGLAQYYALLPVVAILLPLNSGQMLTTCDPALSLLVAAGAVLTGTWAKTPRHLVAGLLLGSAALFRHDFGAYGCLAAVATVSWSEWRILWSSVGTPVNKAFSLARTLAPLLLGMALLSVPAYGLLALRDPAQLLHALIAVPTAMLPYRTLPYFYDLPSLQESPLGGNFSIGAIRRAPVAMVFVTPLLALALSVCLLIPRVRQRTCEVPARVKALLFVLLSAAGVLVYALGRSDSYHVYPLHVLAVCAIGIISTSLWRPAHAGTGSTLTVQGFAGGIGLVLGVMLGAAHVDYTGASALGVPGAGRIVVTDNLAWIPDALADIRVYSHGRPIFVAAPRHDRVLGNAVALYFLSKHRSGTDLHDLIPGVTTTRAVQEEIVSDLKENDVRMVVVWKTHVPDEPNLSRQPGSVYILDSFLHSEFSPVRQTTAYDVLVKR